MRTKTNLSPVADFAVSIRKVLKHEGCAWDENGNLIETGYCNNPDDPGGETIYGITHDEAVENGWVGPISEMPLSFATEIYRVKYWIPLWGEHIDDQGIADEVFDTAVNCGLKTSVIFLQRALNVLNERQKLWPDVAVDGLMGGTTSLTLNTAIVSRPYMRLCILRAIDSLQCCRYIVLAESNPKFETFMPGWLRARCGVEGIIEP